MTGKNEGSERVRRHRLRKSGFEGKPSPVSQERLVAGLSQQEKEDVTAWAEGVWRRQAEQEVRSGVAKRSLLELRAITGGKSE